MPDSLSTLHLRPKVAGDGRLTGMRLWGVWNLVDGLHDRIRSQNLDNCELLSARAEPFVTDI